MVLLNQLSPQRLLIGRLLVVHAVDLFDWSKISLWITMALQAPLHAQLVFSVDDRHLIDLSVTGLASDTLIYVDAVVEESVVT